ncbi:MAG: chromosome segregation protein SMC [Thermoplasmatota archaeon]
MHLREVEMENFKSFGRKLTVPFEPGFTGITGPNGSGKSNIGDAILFVLGPNSPRALRAGKLADLIYNGGEKGSGRDHCSVSLVFDNSDRVMPVEADTVTLTRRIRRSPTDESPDNVNSYFYVNGRSSQKKEFTDLLQHARISADGYNITLQGDVQAICHMTPFRRREILDAIAGVTAFDKDIASADRHKGEVVANLERIGIVLEEIGRNLSQLDKERESATRYRDLQASIQRLRGLGAWRRREAAAQEIAQVQQRIDEFGKERARHEATLGKLRQEQKEAQAKFAEMEAQIRAEGGAEIQEIQTRVDAARDAMVRLEEKLNFCRANAQASREESAPLEEELQRILQEMERTSKGQASSQSKEKAALQELEARRRELDEVRSLIAKSDSGAMQVTRELATLRQEHEAAQLALHEAKLESDRLGERDAALSHAVGEVEAGAELAGRDLAEGRAAAKEAREQLKGAGGQQKEAQRRLLELRKAQAELTRQREDLENRIRRGERELAELRVAQEAADRAQGGLGAAVQMVLEARESRAVKGIIGTVAELGKVEDRYKVALQVAAAGRLNAILVEDDAAAAACIEMLKRSHAGRATFLPLTKMVPGKPRGQALMKKDADGSLGFALDLVEFNPRYHNAFFQVFGDTLVVDGMANARRMMGGIRMVTLDGELFEASGAMTGGSLGRKGGRGDEEAQFGSGDRARIDALLQEVATCERMQGEVAARLAGLRTELDALEAQTATHGLTGQSVEDRLKELERKAEGSQERVAAARAEADRLAAERAEVQKQAQKVARSAEALQAKLQEMEKERLDKGQLLLKGTPKALREKVEGLEERVRVLSESSLQLSHQVAVTAKELEIVEGRRRELATAVADKKETVSRALAEEKRLAAGHAKARAEVEALAKMQSKAAGALKGLAERKDKLYKTIVDLDAKAGQVSHQIEIHFGLVTNAKAKLPALEQLMGEAMAEMAEFPLRPEDLENVPPADELKRDLRNQEAALDRLGPVNMTALEQYEGQSKRQEELRTETARLEAQKADLIRLVAEIQTKKKAALMEVFVAINTSFGQVYEQISLGGKAHLELEHEEDPFQGGLVIKAQPPGKKVLRIDALSGGEKSLTSMAFIFSLQRYDPSPFYYFDEVDQNLDAVNSELLAKMIRDNARFAQFIVVSLRKITLKEANHLYGVTQQAAGESQIIANFDIDTLKDDDRPADPAAPTPPKPAKPPAKGKRERTLNDTIEDMVQIRAGA